MVNLQVSRGAQQHDGAWLLDRRDAYLEFTNNRRFSIRNHHFSGAIPRHLCVFNRKFQNCKLAFILQFAISTLEGPS